VTENKPLTRREQRMRIIEILYQFDMGVAPEPSQEVYVDETVQNVLADQLQIDQILESVLENYKLKRISTVDRAILRLACYELRDTQTPAEIIIDEALRLTHIYTDLGDHKAVSFNNKVLDKMYKQIRGKE
jgi:transcription antitermination protein NusB